MSSDAMAAPAASSGRGSAALAKLRELGPSIGLFLLVGVIWEASVKLFAVPAYLLPAPSVIGTRMWATRVMLGAGSR